VTHPEQPVHRSGFAALVGRPNAGKTTLTNALVGEKVGIVSNRPQTTRHAIRGVVHRPAGQLVLVDTPGLHKPKSLLGQRLNDVVRDTLADVDVIVFCIPADQPVGTGDAFIARQLKNVTTPVVLVVTKTDAAGKKAITEQLIAASKLVQAVEIVPVSAVAGDQVELLADLLIEMLPEGPPLYPEEQTTDEDVERQIAELVREAALEKVRQERCSPRSTRCCTSSAPARSRCCWARAATSSRRSAARPGSGWRRCWAGGCTWTCT
jgi:GTP-binding protein Era